MATPPREQKQIFDLLVSGGLAPPPGGDLIYLSADDWPLLLGRIFDLLVSGGLAPPPDRD